MVRRDVSCDRRADLVERPDPAHPRGTDCLGARERVQHAMALRDVRYVVMFPSPCLQGGDETVDQGVSFRAAEGAQCAETEDQVRLRLVGEMLGLAPFCESSTEHAG